MQQTVIITAGGIGKRMGTAIPKQFMTINGLPILMQTIQCFYNYNNDFQIIVTLPVDWIEYWESLCQQHSFDIPHTICDGGSERYHSIKNALSKANGELIAIHDAVRPFPSQSTLENCFSEAQQKGNAIPVVAMKDSLRWVDSTTTSNVLDRSRVKAVQTPQVFKSELILQAYEGDFHEGITDDASLLEELGVSINLVEGNEENIKITSPFDLLVAELLATKKP